MNQCQSLQQEFYIEILEDENYIEDRKKELRKMAGLDPKDTRVTWKFIGNMDGSSNDHTSEFLFTIMIPSLAVILTISGYQVLLSGRPAQERETAAFSNR